MKTNPLRLKELADALAVKRDNEIVQLPAPFVSDLVDDLRDLLTERETTRVEVAELRDRSKRLVHTLEEMKLLMMRGEE